MKWENYKSKLGLFLVGIYVFLILLALIEVGTRPPEPMVGLGFLILTAPWSFLFFFLFYALGIITSESDDSFFPIFIVLSGFINILILYFIGYLIGKLFNFLSKKIDSSLAKSKRS